MRQAAVRKFTVEGMPGQSGSPSPIWWALIVRWCDLMNVTASNYTLFTWDDWDWSLEAAAPLLLIGLALWVILFKTLAWLTAVYLEKQYPLEANDNDEELFCYSCSDRRKPEKLVILPPEERGHGQDVAQQCKDCGRFLHPNDWLPELVDLFADYHRARRELGAEPLPLNPRFPMGKFVTLPELLTFLVVFASAIFNCYTIISKFRTEVFTPKEPGTQYLLLLRALAIGELCIVLLVFCQCLWLSLRTTMRYRRQRPFRVFLGLLLANSGKMANANVLSVIRMWDVHRVVRFAAVAGHVEHEGPDCWGVILQVMQYIMLGPAVVLFLFGPGVALLVRLFQLEPVTEQHVLAWDSEEWVAFLSFLNNFRYLVTRLDVVGRLGAHLLSSTVFFLFAELMDVTSGARSLLQCVVLVTTSSPSECYELFKGTSNIWLGPPPTDGSPPQDLPSPGAGPALGELAVAEGPRLVRPTSHAVHRRRLGPARE